MLERLLSHPVEGVEPVTVDEPEDIPEGLAHSSENDLQRFFDRELTRFLAAHKDERMAIKRLHSAAPFRIDREPPFYPLSYEKFVLIKELYRHSFIRSSHPEHTNTCVLIDNVGSFNQSLKAFRKHGITDDDVIEHAIFLISYFSNIIDPRPYPHGRLVRVFDLSGFRLAHAGNLRAMRLGLRLTLMAEKYFPERLQDVIVINAHPFAIGVYNRLIRGLLHEGTRKKFQFHSDDAVLHKMLSKEQIDWQNALSPEEEAMGEFVRRQASPSPPVE